MIKSVASYDAYCVFNYLGRQVVMPEHSQEKEALSMLSLDFSDASLDYCLPFNRRAGGFRGVYGLAAT